MFVMTLSTPKTGPLGECLKYWGWGGARLETARKQLKTQAKGWVVERRHLVARRRPPPRADAEEPCRGL